MYAGGLPYEIYLIDLIDRKEYQVIQQMLEYKTITCYLISWTFLHLLGIIFQCKQKQMTDFTTESGLKIKRRRKNSLLQD
jgi:hypothetical protein